MDPHIPKERVQETARILRGMGADVTDPLDVDSLLADANGNKAWSGLADGTTIGHIHLHVANLREAAHFYRDVLGFALMQHYGNAAAFLAAGGYHHHVGVNTWAGIGAPPPPDDAAGLRHFSIRFSTQMALDAVLTRLRDAGVSYETTPEGVTLHDPSQNGILLTTAS